MSIEDIVGKQFDVLDKGFVRVVDYMGGDDAVVQAARVSYGKGTKEVHEDRGLIRYLMRHNHGTPFEMAEIKLHVKVPMDCWRQWIRHRMASVNEYSTRYSEAINEMQETKSDQWRLQSNLNKQGSVGFLGEEVGQILSELEGEHHKDARAVYEGRLAAGVAREQARKDLPLSTYTEAYWKMDLRNLLQFLGLRMDSHAQKEIREYANVIGNEIVARWVPHTWEAFNDYHPLRSAMILTGPEIEVIKGGVEAAERLGWLRRSDTGKLLKNRERSEFKAKAERMGIELPWGNK